MKDLDMERIATVHCRQYAQDTMPSLTLRHAEAPFLLDALGEILVSPEAGGFQVSAGGKRLWGNGAAVKVGVSSDVTLRDLSRSDPALAAFGIEKQTAGSFLLLDAGSDASVTASGSFPYATLKAGVHFDAGVNGGFAYLAPSDRSLAFEARARSFFASARLPEQLDRAPIPGEALLLRYGGYLRLGAEVSAGYSLSGTKSVKLSDIALSEKLAFRAIGKIGLAAQVAGDFAILVTSSDLPGNWARVRAQRRGSKGLSVAADVNVNLNASLDRFPSTADDFLGSVLGVQARSLLGLLKSAQTASSGESIRKLADPLAQDFLSRWFGKSLDVLAKKPELDRFRKLIDPVVSSHQSVGDAAVTLVELHFDRLPALTEHLDRIAALNDASLPALRSDLTAELWDILSQLTGGDPLNALNAGATDLLKSSAKSALALLRDPAHRNLRDFIGEVKSQLSIDKLFRELADLRTVDDLRAAASQRAGQFASRLVGRHLGSAADMKEALKEIHAVLAHLDSFKQKLFDSFRRSAQQSFALALHAGYAQTSEHGSLVDLSINLSHPRGLELYRRAALGDFSESLTCPDPDLVRLQEGVFTHKTTRESAFKVNIVGWHANFQYEGFDRVITETEQRLQSSEHGLQVFTSATLEIEKMRKRRGERMHMDFLLRALGESKRVVPANQDNTAYLIDSLESLSARFQLSFTDPDTSALELEDALAFARDLGIESATPEAVKALLPTDGAGGFGHVEISYDVRFHKAALLALLSVNALSKPQEAALRQALRNIVLANYLRGDTLHDVAFAYATPATFAFWSKQGPGFTRSQPLEFPVQLPASGIRSPTKVLLSGPEFQFLDTLFRIENKMIDAVKSLYAALAADKPLGPSAFEKKLDKFAGALKDFDAFDQTSNKNQTGTATIFFVLDALVRQSAGQAASASVLRIRSKVNGQPVEKLFATWGNF